MAQRCGGQQFVFLRPQLVFLARLMGSGADTADTKRARCGTVSSSIGATRGIGPGLTIRT